MVDKGHWSTMTRAINAQLKVKSFKQESIPAVSIFMHGFTVSLLYQKNETSNYVSLVLSLKK